MTFYKNKLTEIHTDYSTEISEALKLKYGNPKIEKKEDVNECTTANLLIDLKFKSTLYYQTWSNEDVSCVAVVGNYINRKCEKVYMGYIFISKNSITEQIRKCDAIIEHKTKDIKAAQKKKELTDF